MLTRLRVKGFKNLYDVDLSFGPFTCVAGSNGVGKSNLFDAIEFLGRLADESFLDAAASVRGTADDGADVRALFFANGAHTVDRISFEAEIIVGPEGEDHLGQLAVARSTFLRYRVDLGLQVSLDTGVPRMRLLHESLVPIAKGEAHLHLPFAPKRKAWRESVVRNKNGTAFISTEGSGEGAMVLLHQDGGSRGKANRFLTERLPRTVLSSASANESPTVLLARRELRSWKLLQLEPSSMRRPDRFVALERTEALSIGTDGSHLPAALYALARAERASGQSAEADLFMQFGNRLGTLVNDVREVRVDKDDKCELLTIEVCGTDGVFHPARALSDGTLRFLALAIIERTAVPDVICLEEPENGIHPSRIEAMLALLGDIAVDVDFPVDAQNPLRQVIINTHSPGVVENVPAEAVVFAETMSLRTPDTGARISATRFVGLRDTWRSRFEPETPTKSVFEVRRYLEYAAEVEREPERAVETVRALVDRQLAFGFPADDATSVPAR